MPAPNLDASRLGLINAAGGGTWAGDNAMFLKVWSGEVLTAFKKACVFTEMTKQRTIPSGKEASFPIIGVTTSSYHSAGTMITGQSVKHAEATVRIDDKLICPVFIADIDEAKNHYDVRSQYTTEMGNSLAYRLDSNISAMIAKAARTTTNFNTDLPGGTRVKIVAASKAAITGSQLAASLFSAAIALDEKNIPKENRYAVFGPTEYYKLVQSTDVINRDWGGQGAYSDGTVLRVAGIQIVKSNLLPNATRTAVTGEQNDYTGTFADCVGLVFNEMAVGTVKLMDLKMQQTGNDVSAIWQGTFMVASMAVGTGILRPDCAVDIYTATS
jgi:hypothetical protein